MRKKPKEREGVKSQHLTFAKSRCVFDVKCLDATPLAHFQKAVSFFDRAGH